VVGKRGLDLLDINLAEQKKMLTKKGTSGNAWQPVPKNKQNNQKLTGKQIIELAHSCIQIEKHYQKPQDIEWAFAKGKFYITQSRPITTL